MGKKLNAEAEAAASLVQGEEAGLNFFFELYYTPLTWFALKLTDDEGAAEDVVTEAFLKLWNHRHELKSPAYIKAYLYRVVRNACIDFLRSRKRKAVHEKQAAYLGDISESTVLARLIETEFHHQIFLSLQNLPPRMGKVFRMFYLQGKTYQEIADELKISIHTVRNQKVRALELLREHLLVLMAMLLGNGA